MKGGRFVLNNVILVGRVVEDPQLIVLDNGYKVANIVLAIQKPFRNEANEFETDFVPVQAWMRTAEIICDYIGKGSVLGCKCRLQTKVVEVNDVKLKSIDVIVERISFIHTKPRVDKNSQKEELDEICESLDDDVNNELVIDQCEENFEKK